MKTTFWPRPSVLALGALLAACGIGFAHAAPFVEESVCTVRPGAAWLGEEKIKAIFGVREYVKVEFKVSKTNCYEFYAIRKNGDVVEAYYHPVTGEIVKRSVLLHTVQITDTTAGTTGAVVAAAAAAASSAASVASAALR